MPGALCGTPYNDTCLARCGTPYNDTCLVRYVVHRTMIRAWRVVVHRTMIRAWCIMSYTVQVIHAWLGVITYNNDKWHVLFFTPFNADERWNLMMQRWSAYVHPLERLPRKVTRNKRLDIECHFWRVDKRKFSSQFSVISSPSMSFNFKVKGLKLRSFC